jgi:hypothetical protein
MNTRTITGPNRGDVEAVLSYLASLGPATVVGGVGGGGIAIEQM